MIRRFDAPEQKSGTVYVSDTPPGSKAAER